ncbi:MAG: hypothetical protein MZW92_09080 [Comamonadaceae bacterium]|nr:hypothetical protein [Comamonadaceae bacterium]
MLKAGRKPAGNEAAQTHSGAIVGSDDVFDAALRRAGAVRVRSFVAAVLGGQVPGLALPAGGQAAGHRHQRRRPRCAGGRLGQRDRPRSWASCRLRMRPGPAAAACPHLASLVRSDRPVRGRHAGALPTPRIEAASKDNQVDGVLVIYSPKAGVDAAAVAQRAGGSQAAHEQAAADLLDGRRLGGRGPRHPERAP